MSESKQNEDRIEEAFKAGCKWQRELDEKSLHSIGVKQIQEALADCESKWVEDKAKAIHALYNREEEK